MRMLPWLAGAALVALSAGASAQEVDCDALRTTRVPFQITFAAWPIASGGQVTPAAVEQHHRGGDGAGRRLRRNVGQMQVTTMETRHGFATRVHSRGGAQDLDVTFDTEGLALDRDHFAVPEDFSYRRRVRFSSGRGFIDDNRARFRGEEQMTVSGCAFRVLVWDIERRNPAPGPGQPAESVESFWYAPELGAFLRTRVSAAGAVQDRIAASIETRFAPFE